MIDAKRIDAQLYVYLDVRCIDTQMQLIDAQL